MTYTIRNRHMNWKRWSSEYRRLTNAGYSNSKAEKMADDYITRLGKRNNY